MSKVLGHKVQLALSVLKGKKVELERILENGSGGGNWRRLIITRISEIDKEIKEINERFTKK